MRYLIFDTETSIFQKGNPFSRCNKVCYTGFRLHTGEYVDFPMEYQDYPYGESIKRIQEIINEHDCIVGFNLKFDLHWLLRYGLVFSDKRIFDTQLAEFILSRQSAAYPSLNGTAIGYGLDGKLDVIKTEYWDKGIDTPDVPEDVLRPYLQQDVDQTWQVFCKQQERITPENRTLISLANQDLLALLEIEHNGMLYDVDTSVKLGDDIQTELDSIDFELRATLECPQFSPGSGDHISAALYGGVLKYPGRETYTYTYKDGSTTEKSRNCVIERLMPQLVRPPKGAELAKAGYYATNEPTLRSLRVTGKAKRFIQLILRRSELEKRRGTYLHGLPKLIETIDWEPGTIHGQLNQCVAVTGRLSSSQPNLQNFDKDIANLFVTRY